jgi:hypothetical protein
MSERKWQARGSFTGPRHAVTVLKNYQRAGRLGRLGEGKINQVDWVLSRNFRFLLGLPALKIRAEDEEFAPDLDDANLLFLNDSAEMAYGKASQAGGVWDI